MIRDRVVLLQVMQEHTNRVARSFVHLNFALGVLAQVGLWPLLIHWVERPDIMYSAWLGPASVIVFLLLEVYVVWPLLVFIAGLGMSLRRASLEAMIQRSGQKGEFAQDNPGIQ